MITNIKVLINEYLHQINKSKVFQLQKLANITNNTALFDIYQDITFKFRITNKYCFILKFFDFTKSCKVSQRS